jgi:4-hydroxy-3-methylbut-2-enyl diphosphate reductase
VASLTVCNPSDLAFVTQTTLSMDDTAEIIGALRARFPGIHGPRKDDICYATQNRQDAVRALAPQCDVFVVVGSPNSSNSNRLREVAHKLGTPAYLVDSASDLERAWFEGAARAGVAAGASAPEVLVAEVIEKLREWGGREVNEQRGKRESVVFSLPRNLTRIVAGPAATD